MFEEKDYNSDVESAENESVNMETKNKPKVDLDVDSDVEEEYNEKDSDMEEEDEIDENDLDEDDVDSTTSTEKNAPTKPSIFTEPADIDDDEEDDENEDDEDYLQKFDESMRQQIIQDFHPELKTHNYDEIETLSKIVRDNFGNIIDPFHKTLPFITKYEKARILGERASQINAGAQPLVIVDPDMIDGYVIALKEYEAKKIPFIIKRPLPNGTVEYWKFEDLELI